MKMIFQVCQINKTNFFWFCFFNFKYITQTCFFFLHKNLFSFYTKSHCSKQFLTPNVPGIPLTKHERCQSPQLNVKIKMASLLAEKKKKVETNSGKDRKNMSISIFFTIILVFLSQRRNNIQCDIKYGIFALLSFHVLLFLSA